MLSLAHVLILLVVLVILALLVAGIIAVIWFATGQPARRRAAEAQARAERAERETDGLV